MLNILSKRVLIYFIIFLNTIFSSITSNSYYVLYTLPASNSLSSITNSLVFTNSDISSYNNKGEDINVLDNSVSISKVSDNNLIIDKYENVLIKYATLDYEYIQEYSRVIVLLDFLLSNKKYTNYQKNKIVHTIITEYDNLKHEFLKYNVSIYDIISIILTESNFDNIKKIDSNGEYSIGIFQIQYVAYKHVFNKWSDLKGGSYSDYLNIYDRLDIQIKTGMRYYLLMLLSTNNKYYALNKYNGRRKFKDMNSPYIKRFNKMRNKISEILGSI